MHLYTERRSIFNDNIHSSFRCAILICEWDSPNRTTFQVSIILEAQDSGKHPTVFNTSLIIWFKPLKRFSSAIDAILLILNVSTPQNEQTWGKRHIPCYCNSNYKHVHKPPNPLSHPLPIENTNKQHQHCSKKIVYLWKKQQNIPLRHMNFIALWWVKAI